MYAGIISLNAEKNDNGDDILLAMNSKEGETVEFAN